MKILSPQVSNFFKRLVSKKSKPEYHRDSLADWQRLLFVFIVLALGIAGFCGYFFFKLGQGELFIRESIQTQTPEIVNKRLLEEINGYYDRKEAWFNNVVGSTTVPIDPSL
ncbi:hypothetical protein KW782_04115 [Candidatus Parcubacteria bacterium]|nr:hypothetical protein [Candidatus Parcubacteria bacterium]